MPDVNTHPSCACVTPTDARSRGVFSAEIVYRALVVVVVVCGWFV